MQFVRKHPFITVVSLTLLCGILGFVGGIVWCDSEYPASPQAPLFGIFITGPAGLVIGFFASLALVVRSVSSNNGKDKSS